MDDFSWSKSRDEIFNYCLRKYYYQYYGSKGEVSDLKILQLKVLKGLRAKELWVGNLVHEMVQYLLVNYKVGRRLHLTELLKLLRVRFDFYYNFSIKKNYRELFGQGGFFEHEYCLEFDKEELFKYAEKCLINFFNSDAFKFIKESKDWLFIEDLLTFDFEGEMVWLKIDFAVREGDKIILFDWKTGKERDVEMDVQLGCYALYVMQKFKVSNVIFRKYNLNLDKEDVYNVDAELISRIKAYMRESIGSMKEMHECSENSFVRTEDLKKCGYCNYKKVCRV